MTQNEEIEYQYPDSDKKPQVLYDFERFSGTREFQRFFHTTEELQTSITSQLRAIETCLEVGEFTSQFFDVFARYNSVHEIAPQVIDQSRDNITITVFHDNIPALRAHFAAWRLGGAMRESRLTFPLSAADELRWFRYYQTPFREHRCLERIETPHDGAVSRREHIYPVEGGTDLSIQGDTFRELGVFVRHVVYHTGKDEMEYHGEDMGKAGRYYWEKRRVRSVDEEVITYLRRTWESPQEIREESVAMHQERVVIKSDIYSGPASLSENRVRQFAVYETNFDQYAEVMNFPLYDADAAFRRRESPIASLYISDFDVTYIQGNIVLHGSVTQNFLNSEEEICTLYDARGRHVLDILIRSDGIDLANTWYRNGV